VSQVFSVVITQLSHSGFVILHGQLYEKWYLPRPFVPGLHWVEYQASGKWQRWKQTVINIAISNPLFMLPTSSRRHAVICRVTNRQVDAPRRCWWAGPCWIAKPEEPDIIWLSDLLPLLIIDTQNEFERAGI